MKSNLKLIALALLGLVFTRPAAYCTANAEPDDIATLRSKLAAQDAELERLRAVEAGIPERIPGLTPTQALIVKGSDLPDAKDVLWRMDAGLEFETALEAALSQHRERAAAAAKKEEATK